MNYNEEYRTPRDRVTQDSVRNASHSCGCGSANSSDINRTVVTNRVAEHNVHHSNCGCNNNNSAQHIMQRNFCGCDNNTRITREVREATDNCPNTVCTTVPVKEGCVDTYPIAMAYVPMQQWRDLYDPISAHSHGTIFRELDLEWYPTNCRKDGR